MESIVILGAVAVLVALAAWLGYRWTKRPAFPSDLRRADAAEDQDTPTAAELQERVGEAFGETRPSGW